MRVHAFALLTLASCSTSPSAIYDPCVSAEHGVLSAEDAPFGLAVDAGFVYWSTSIPIGEQRFRYEIRRIDRAGGTAETLVMGTDPIGAIAINSTELFWFDGRSLLALNKQSLERREVGRLPLRAGTADTFTLAADDTAAYVLTQDFSDTFRYAVWRMAIDGSSALIATHELPVGTNARAMQLHNQVLYWAFQAGWMFRAPVDLRDGSAEQLFDDALGVDGFVAASGQLTFISDSAIRSMPLSGGEPTSIAPGADAYRAIARDGDWTVWGTRDPHSEVESIRIRYADEQSCTLVTEGVTSARTMAHYDGVVYWANTALRSAGGAIRWVRVS